MKKILLISALASLLTVTSVTASSRATSSNKLSLLVPENSTIETESQKQIDSLKSRYFNLILGEKEITTNLNQLELNLSLQVEETSSNKITNYASFFTKEKNYTYTTEIYSDDNFNKTLLDAFKLPSEPTNPKLQFVDNEFQVIQGEIGYKITNTNEVKSAINSAIESNQQDSVSILIKELKPTVTNEQLQSQKDKLESFNDTKITLTTEDRYSKEINLTKTDLALSTDSGLEISDEAFNTLVEEIKPHLEKQKQDTTLKSIDPETKEVQIEGDMMNGKSINQPLLRSNINQALRENIQSISIPLDIEEAKVINLFNDKNYSLLGSGVSNYSGSGPGRVHNIQFASDERYKALYVPQGETFKFNSHLGGPVTLSRGWQTAYVISGGKIVPAPGGGICQMSTTFYRAALEAGLQIDWASNHSLYVHYYSAYGDGLDAAIFPGSKDLHFTNNTPGDIILQSYYDPEIQDLVVNVIGEDDGRTIELFGPFNASDNASNPFDIQTRTNQINWVRQITDANGNKSNETLTSTYSRFYRY